MALICIAREEGIDAHAIAETIARETGFKLLDKEVLEKAMVGLGLKEDVLKKYDEVKPGFWASLSQERDDYLHYLEYAMYESALDNDCLIIGRGANAIFAGFAGVITAKIVAPLSWRLRALKPAYNGDEKKALQGIKQSDENRKGFTRYFFNIDWADPASYSCTFNLASFDQTSIALAIKSLVSAILSKTVKDQFRVAVQEHHKGALIVDTVIYKHGIPINFFEAEVHEGKAILHGVSSVEPTIEKAAELVRTIPGITEVENAIQLVQDYTIMP